MSILNYASNPFFDNDELGYITVGRSRLEYEKKARDRFPLMLDLIQTQSQYVLICDVPGIPKDRIKIEVKDNRIILEGKRKKKIVCDSDIYLLQQRLNGPFRRVIEVPVDCDVSTIAARLEDGLLVLTMQRVI
ncbi:hypothetical protein WA171_001280, partial [Blastocystis sp. BT1]